MQLKLKKKKKICAVCDRLCQKWFAKFRAGDFHWTMLHSQEDQLKLIMIKSKH